MARAIVFGVNDIPSRIGWFLLALLCVYGAVNAVKTMNIETDQDNHLIYKYLGIFAVTIYLIQVVTSIFIETPSPVYRDNRWVRTIVPLKLFFIIYFTIYNFQTVEASVLVLSIVFGLFVMVQLCYPLEGFYFLYVVMIMILGCFLALFAFGYDPKIQPFWFCFLTIFVVQSIIYFFNFPGKDYRPFSFY